jgi:CO dehydrogenase/acetyl-CoA synthase delta subunit
MAVDLPKRSYSGTIREIVVGKGDKSFKVGGETAYPFYTFEGAMPNPPKFGLDVLDIEPDDWADELKSVFGDVWNDPAAWAKKCVDLGADMIQLTLQGTDPNDKNLGADHAVEVAKKVSEAVDVPLAIWGTANAEILIDPTVGGLGYGLEYTYSVMERARMAALTQQDEKLQFPIYCNLGIEVWKTKEAKLPDNEMNLGEHKQRGLLMESVTVSSLLAAGADILIVRHPDSMKLGRQLVTEMLAG